MNPTTLTNITNVIGAALKAHESNPGAEYNFAINQPSTSVSFAQTREQVCFGLAAPIMLWLKTVE